MNYLKSLGPSIIWSYLVLLYGCSSHNPGDIEAFMKPNQTNVAASNYVLQPPDEIEVHCSKVPEIHLQRQRIRQDGKISLEYLGEVQAAGKTPKELEDTLYQKLSTLYTLPNSEPVEVRVVSPDSKVYYVLGQVLYPGPMVCTGRDSVLTALAKAQPTTLAWTDYVRVIRPCCEPNGKPKVFELNYEDMAGRGNTSKNVLLQEGDVIYVQPTVLAALAMKVEEVVRPIGRAFSTVNVVQPPTAR